MRFLALPALLFLVPLGAAANEDMRASLESFEKIYTASDPIGPIRLTWSSQDADKPTLALECRLFKGTVPAAGLTDLPGPNWDALTVAYFTTTAPMIAGRPSLEPYAYVSVPLLGPRGEAWEQTWVTFHFDTHGVTRKIKRFTRDEEHNWTTVIWTDWPAGSGITAEQALSRPRR